MPAGFATSALAALALSMARSVDDPSTTATPRSMCARVLLDALAQLRDLAPAEDEADAIDDLAARPALRLAGGTAPKG